MLPSLSLSDPHVDKSCSCPPPQNRQVASFPESAELPGGYTSLCPERPPRGPGSARGRCRADTEPSPDPIRTEASPPSVRFEGTPSGPIPPPRHHPAALAASASPTPRRGPGLTPGKRTDGRRPCYHSGHSRRPADGLGCVRCRTSGTVEWHLQTRSRR